MSGHLCLKWNNHSTAFLKNIRNVQTKEKYCDATIACSGKYFPVHRIVLSTCSDYFEEMFERMQCQHPYIVFKDIEPHEMELLLNYMYQGEVNVIQERLPSLIKAAEALKVKGLAVPDDVPSTKDSSSKRRSNNIGSPAPKRRSDEKRRKHVSDANSSSAQKDNFTRDTSKVFISEENDEPRIIKEEPFHPVDFGDDFGTLATDTGAPPLPEENQGLGTSEKDFEAFSSIAEPPPFIKTEMPSKDETLEEPSSSWSDFPEEASVGPPNPPNPPLGEGIHQEDMPEPNMRLEDFGPQDGGGNFPSLLDPEANGRTWPSSALATTKQHRCPFCSYSSHWNTNVKEHVMFKHTGERPYSCNFCPKGFTSNKNLRIHMRTHTGEKPFKCSICFMRFCRKSSLKSHMARKYQCSKPW